MLPRLSSLRLSARLAPVALAVALLLTLLIASGRDVPAVRAVSSTASYLPAVIVSPLPPIEAEPVGRNLSGVVAITHAGDERVFVAQRDGLVVVIQPDGTQNTFLDLRDHVDASLGERGFFDLAFHPDYTKNGFFFVSYTSTDDDLTYTFVARFRVSADPNVADPASEARLISVRQFNPVHKGGSLVFDSRGNRLYVGIGDDLQRAAVQDVAKPYGKVVRVAVDAVDPLLVGDVTNVVKPDLVALGLRNPWRLALDEVTDRLFIADVGENMWEEINLQPLDELPLNFGWPCMEGPRVFPGAPDIAACRGGVTFTDAIHAYEQQFGLCAVVGGPVYRPASNPADGRYLFSDFCEKDLKALRQLPGGAWQVEPVGRLKLDGALFTFGTDHLGRVYAGLGQPQIPVYRLTIP